jgi:hypothetical protein
MLIKANVNAYSSVRCPFNGFNCVGPVCGVWRWEDYETGFCGAGGTPVDRPAKVEPTPPPSAAVTPEMRFPRDTTKGAVERTRR